MLSVREGSKHTVQLLLENGADTNKRNKVSDIMKLSCVLRALFNRDCVFCCSKARRDGSDSGSSGPAQGYRSDPAGAEIHH